MLVKEIIYACLDLAKAATSDDSFLNEGHVLFLLKKYRAMLIKKEQEKDKATTNSPTDNEYTQQICLDLEEVEPVDGDPCNPAYYTRSVQEIPKMIDGFSPRIYPVDFYQGINICFVSRDRMRYVGTNKYLENIIFCSLSPDGHLYFTSNNPQFSNLGKIRLTGVFEDFEEALKYLCEDDSCYPACDIMEAEFPIKYHLVPTMVELAVKELVGANYRPIDKLNDAADNMAELATFLRNNVKSALQKQIEG